MFTELYRLPYFTVKSANSAIKKYHPFSSKSAIKTLQGKEAVSVFIYEREIFRI